MNRTGQDYQNLGENYPSFLLSLKSSKLKKETQPSECNSNVSYENILDEKPPSIAPSSNESAHLMRDQLVRKEVCFIKNISLFCDYLTFR